MIIDKVIRNIYGIGGAIIVSAFGISFIATSVKAKRMPLNYETGRFNGTINSISSIEDLEYSKGCKFYFYDAKLITKNGIKPARDYHSKEDKTDMFKQVQEKAEECTKGRFFYIKPKP